MTLLLVEDDKGIVEFLRRGLVAEGYQLDIADHGRRALALAMSASYQLIILDLMLPDLDGREVCRQLRDKHIHTPILMLTALDAIEDKVEGLRLGADDYLTKPFAFEELLARIAALIRRGDSYGNNQALLRVGTLEMDRNTHQVTWNARILELTPREFALLEYLMMNPGIVLSRSQILQNVWELDSDPLTNVVEVYIRHLRSKIDQDETAPVIETVRGFGYKLNVPDQRPGR